MSLELIQEAAVRAGAPKASVMAAIGAAAGQGIPLAKLLALALKFAPLGVQVWQIIADVIAAIKGPDGFAWENFAELITEKGPAVIALIQAIASLLHATLPEVPAALRTPAT